VTRYLATRLTAAIPILLGVSLLVFLMLHLTDLGASTEEIEQMREELGLNDPLPVQFGRFISNAVQGDFGRSILSRRPVSDEILSQLPATLQLTATAMGFAIVLGPALGIIAAVKRNTWIDTTTMVFAVVGISMPSVWFALLLIYFFSLQLGWLPAIGQGGIERLIMPAFSLALPAAAIIARLTRSSMIEVMSREFVITARSKGISERAVVIRHALKNALIPVITIVGLQFGGLLAGTVITETVFSRPGIGRLAVSAILAKDFPVVQGVVLVTAVAYVCINIIVDVLYAVVDPRVTYGG
jgi:ABC-type dipeptide/oligopeptide/nickel transport system permease component